MMAPAASLSTKPSPLGPEANTRIRMSSEKGRDRSTFRCVTVAPSIETAAGAASTSAEMADQAT